MEKLPAELVELIMHKTYIPDIPNVLAELVQKRGEITGNDVDIAMDRVNPLIYLSKLTDNVEDLIKFMDRYGIVLGGSRATEYFYPGSCSESSDWDFVAGAKYNPGVTKRVVMEFGNILECEFKEIHTLEGFHEYSHLNFEMYGSTVLSNEKAYSVQLIKSQEHHGSCIESILGFDLSASMCFISSTCAVSMYDNIDKRKELLPLFYTNEVRLMQRETNVLCRAHSSGEISTDRMMSPLFMRSVFRAAESENERQNLTKELSNYSADFMRVVNADCLCDINFMNERVSKYIRRGYSVLPFSSYADSTKGWQSVSLPRRSPGKPVSVNVRTRRIGDSDSLVVPFARWTNALVTDYDSKLHHMLNYAWVEGQNFATFIGNDSAIYRIIFEHGVPPTFVV